ncbi:Uu.00g014180.m01.CDS01 [Anthostomella pinea]|uniref:Uu.00g014180.m01.CDS01 n=1 Tax=Anthostomella pinea TaxID=933095 RepID=A0AAI8VY95_9PEZI|nr:Uu.00g014180.m01.CDS01 [Anthostomella pinea]
MPAVIDTLLRQTGLDWLTQPSDFGATPRAVLGTGTGIISPPVCKPIQFTFHCGFSEEELVTSFVLAKKISWFHVYPNVFGAYEIPGAVPGVVPVSSPAPPSPPHNHEPQITDEAQNQIYWDYDSSLCALKHHPLAIKLERWLIKSHQAIFCDDSPDRRILPAFFHCEGSDNPQQAQQAGKVILAAMEEGIAVASDFIIIVPYTELKNWVETSWKTDTKLSTIRVTTSPATAPVLAPVSVTATLTALPLPPAPVVAAALPVVPAVVAAPAPAPAPGSVPAGALCPFPGYGQCLAGNLQRHRIQHLRQGGYLGCTQTFADSAELGEHLIRTHTSGTTPYGHEGSIAVFIMTRTYEVKCGFVASPQRLRVGFTRHRDALWVFGDIDLAGDITRQLPKQKMRRVLDDDGREIRVPTLALREALEWSCAILQLSPTKAHDVLMINQDKASGYHLNIAMGQSRIFGHREAFPEMVCKVLLYKHTTQDSNSQKQYANSNYTTARNALEEF